MKKSIKVVFIKQFPDDDKGTVYIRTRENGTTKKKTLSEKVTTNQWEKYFNPNKQRFKKNNNFPRFLELNYKIDQLVKDLIKHDYSIDLLPDDKKSFMDYWKSLIETFNNHGSKIKHQTIYNKLEKYLKSDNRNGLRFIEITPAFLRSLKYYLGKSEDPKKLSTNSVGHYLKVIKSVINKATKEDHYYYHKDPFSAITFDHERNNKKVLSKEEVQKILDTKIENKTLFQAQQLWLFLFFANGMRISDALTLRWNNFKDGRMIYRMIKTSTEVSIPVNINMCHSLSSLLGIENKYHDLNRDHKFNIKDLFNYEKYFEDYLTLIYSRFSIV